MDEHDIHKCHSATLLNTSSGCFQCVRSSRIDRDGDPVSVIAGLTELNARQAGKCFDDGLPVDISVVECSHNTGDHGLSFFGVRAVCDRFRRDRPCECRCLSLHSLR